MEQNELLIPERLLTGTTSVQKCPITTHRNTGYIPGAEATTAVVALAEKLRQRRPELIYLLDRTSSRFRGMFGRVLTHCVAVLGDSGRLYVSPEVVPIYRNALRLATIITPNWFEVECVCLATRLPFDLD